MSHSQAILAYQAHVEKMKGNGLKPLSYFRFLSILNQLGY
jgi:hypothetical protein